MSRLFRHLLPAVVLAVTLNGADAGVIHKWVDADGVTHYSDAPPAAAPSPVTQIQVPQGAPNPVAEAYYSIANQWQRLHRERLELERVRLERERLRAAQRPAQPEIVVIESQPRNSVTLYHKPHRRHYHKHRHKKYADKLSRGSIPRNWLAQQQRGGLYRPKANGPVLY